MVRHAAVILAAALLAALLIGHAHSCGDDFFFHLQSWFDAAAQLRHGNLYPHWTFHAAYNAGEPRFIFYPPISWEVGGLFAALLPFSWLHAAVAFVVFCIAGLSAYTLVRPWASETAALLASCLFLANPYMLLDLISRAAYGQIFATAFFPLLLAAMLRSQLSPWRTGLPLALMWLSNVPVGILGTYLYVLFAAFRLGNTAYTAARPLRPNVLFTELRALTGGFVYALTLPAFFLLPAIYQRRYIRMQDAFLPRLRVTDNTLGNRTLDPVRDFFLLLTEHVAIGMTTVTIAVLALAAWRMARQRGTPEPHSEPHRIANPAQRQVLLLVAILSALVLFGISFLSAALWKHLPALWVVQFPWRLLFALGLCLALSLALLLHDVRLPFLASAAAALALSASLALLATNSFFRACEYPNAAQAFVDGLARNHTLDAVNEYVVAGGDNGAMRPDNPPFWLTPDPQAFAPGTTPNLSDVDPNAEAPEAPPDAQLSLTPLHFTVYTPAPTFLVINLQDYPQWIVHAGAAVPPHTHRADGLVAIPVHAGQSDIHITWRHSLDEVLGWSISVLALLAFAFATRPWQRGLQHPPATPRS